ncbi:MAG: sigma-70 family RNA polymerase sigma factor [Bacteroidales bacterium]|nr:sigma-70 family RNA polymerase sigma factor [Bacteroidales bacterium]
MYVDIKTMREVSMGNPDITSRFFKDMRRLKPLSSEKQTELIKEYAKCDDNKRKDEIRDALVLANEAFIVSMARHLATADDFNDLVSEGNIGMMKAIKDFNVERDNKFLTYAAYHIHKAMVEYQNNVKKMIKPKNVARVYAYSEDAKNKFFTENARYPSDDELIYVLDEQGISFSNKEDLHDITVTSIDGGFFETNTDVTPTDLFDAMCYTRNDVNKDESSITKHIDKMTTHQMAEAALSVLNEKEQDIVRKYFGIGCRQMSPCELAYEKGLNGDGDKIERRIKRYIKKIRNNGKIDFSIY